jgi:hypothetical protein
MLTHFSFLQISSVPDEALIHLENLKDLNLASNPITDIQGEGCLTFKLLLFHKIYINFNLCLEGEYYSLLYL